MQEDSPKLLVTSPTVIEGEIQHGYESVTGFENILCAKSPEQEKHGTSLKRNTSAFNMDYPSDSLSSSSDGLYTSVADPRNMTLRFDRVRNNHKTSGNYVLKDNGHITENGPKLIIPDPNVSPPATPGHIHDWEAELFAHYNEPKPAEPALPKRQSTKRKPFFRQNAQEMNELTLEKAVEKTKTKVEPASIFDSSYL